MFGDTSQDKPIVVLMGGLSAEREVSLRTGAAVLQALKRLGHPVFSIDVARDLPSRLTWQQASRVFIALHGRYGEDGTVQGLLEMMQLPYTGSGVLASSMAMDKVVTKKLLVYHQQPTPEFTVLTAADLEHDLLPECPPLPVVVKPAREGSTIGITLVRKPEQLREALLEALRHDKVVLVEEFIAGREVTVGVLDGEALPIIEVVPKSGFYDYQAKYTAGCTEYLLPAPLDQAVYSQLQRVAVEVFHILGCSGAARVDFMVRNQDIFCLEVNTIPGMTETSLLPKAAAAAGISFDQLVERILAGTGLNK